MELYVNCLRSLFKIFFLKIRYGRKISVSPIQGWGKHGRIIINGEDAKVCIGKRAVARDNVIFRVENGKLKIGDKCFFNGNVSITCIDEVSIGNGCQFANNLVIVDHDHNYKAQGEGDKTLVSSPVKIGNNVWIGANCTVLRGSVIGDNAVIAAGSVVMGTIPENTLFYQKKENMQREIVNIGL